MTRTTASRRYDLVIVGAGFAGLSCARTAAMRGLRVCVLEAKPGPGARIHTTGILVKEAADELDVPHELTRRVHGVRLYGPSLHHMDLFAPGSYFLTTQTSGVLEWLADEARRAGAHILCNAPFRGAERNGDLIRIGGCDFETRYLIGADGARSRVAAAFGLGRNERFLVGVEAEYRDLQACDPRFLHCFIDSRLAPGYIGWAAPGPQFTQVGLATNMSRAPDLQAFVDRTRTLFDYRAADVVERRSGRIPCGGTVDPIGATGVSLIGDAAGLVSPMTGGGIRLAFRSGRRAAQLVSDHLLDAGPSPAFALASEYPRFAVKKILRSGLDIAPANALLDGLLNLPGMAALARQIYFHRRGAPGISWSRFQEQVSTLEKSSREHGFDARS